MKKLIFVACIAFAACSSNEDPAPKFDCAKLLKEAQTAEKAYETQVNAHPGANAASYVLTDHFAKVKEKKVIMEDKYKIYSNNCK